MQTVIIEQKLYKIFKETGDATTKMSKQQEIIRVELESEIYGAYTNEKCNC